MNWYSIVVLVVALFGTNSVHSASLHDRSKCKVDDINLKQNFDVKQFAGKWYDIGRIDIAQQSFDLGSGFRQFIITDEGHLEMHYVGEIAGKCQSPLKGVSATYLGSKFFFDVAPHSMSGPYWVVDTDYRNFAIMFGCYKHEVDGSCAEDSGMVHILGRQKTVTLALMKSLELVIEHELCVDPAKMKYIKHTVDCPTSSPESQLNALNDDVDVAKEAPDSGAEKKTNSLKDEIKSKLSDEQNQVDVPDSDVKDGQPEKMPKSLPKKDDQMPEPENPVAKAPVPETLPEETPVPETLPEETPVPENVPGQTIVPDNLPEEHPLPENVPSEYENIMAESCNVDELPTQDNFDAEQFAGLWYEIEKTESDNSLESGMYNFEYSGDNLMTFSYAGLRNGVCSGPFRASLKPVAEDPADLNMQLTDSPWPISFGYKVIYTDYNNTVIHVCLGSNPNGSCEKSSEQVTILSRTADMDVSRRSELRDIVSQDLCMDVTDLVDVEHKEICQEELGVEVPVDCSKKPMCLMYCENGFVTGQDGCPICECKETDVLEDSSGEGSEQETEKVVTNCPLTMCMIYCQFGFKTDDNGCDMCACNESPAEASGETEGGSGSGVDVVELETLPEEDNEVQGQQEVEEQEAVEEEADNEVQGQQEVGEQEVVEEPNAVYGQQSTLIERLLGGLGFKFKIA